LTFAYFFYLVDRSAIMITQELVKTEFHLTDSQIGLLTGTVYGIAYCLAGLPIGWMVDRFNRRNLIVTILAIWSALTAACGINNTGYWQLLAARVGVGALQSGGAPVSLSMLSDLFPRERQSTVAGIFFAGTSVGVLANFLFGGLIAQTWGWRAVFLISGLPGLALAALIFFTVREPTRRESAAVPAARSDSLLRSTMTVLSTPVVGKIYLAAMFFCMASSAVMSWLVSFLMRVHHLDVATAGAILAVSVGGFSIAGMVGAGVLADFAARRVRGGALFVVALAAAISFVFGMAALEAESLVAIVICLCIYGATQGVYTGPTTAVISQLVPSQSRGVALALTLLLVNFIGSGVGPVAVGLISDRGGPDMGLSKAMQIMLLVNLAAILFYVWAGYSMKRSAASAQTAEAGA
jgi:predicted MFS family arabinose efflux permease